MLVIPTYARKAPSAFAASVHTVNLISGEIATGVSRFVEAIDPPAPRPPLPDWVSQSDYIGLNGGGYVGKLPDTFEKSDLTVTRSFLSTPDDRFVKVETATYYEGQLYAQHSAGDGVTPFPVPPEPNPQFASIGMGIDIKFPGQWREIHRLYYESGRTETFERSYTVEGDPSTAFEDAELYVAGLPIPQYDSDWQSIADFWNGRNELKRAAAQAKADAAPAKPNSVTHPYSFPLNTTDGTAPADVQQAKAIADAGVTALSDGVTAYESLAATNPVQAALNELSHYAAIVESWNTLSTSAVDTNLYEVAKANKNFTSIFLDGSRLAHNGQLSFTQADANWELYEKYMAWFVKQSASELVNMEVWDVILNQPT